MKAVRSGMVLALDTSTRIGSVAVARDGEVLGRAPLREQGTHASHILVQVNEALNEAGVDKSEVEAVIVGAGPGSFTGVRVAAATAKGLAHVWRCPLWAFSSLAAGAASIGLANAYGIDVTPAPLDELERGRGRYVLFDARADRVYAACYLPSETGLDVLVAPHATTISELLAGEAPYAVFGGDGAVRHAGEIQGAGFAVLPNPYGLPTADGLIRVWATQVDAAPVPDAAAWSPDYLRATGAERVRAG